MTRDPLSVRDLLEHLRKELRVNAFHSAGGLWSLRLQTADAKPISCLGRINRVLWHLLLAPAHAPCRRRPCTQTADTALRRRHLGDVQRDGAPRSVQLTSAPQHVPPMRETLLGVLGSLPLVQSSALAGIQWTIAARGSMHLFKQG